MRKLLLTTAAVAAAICLAGCSKTPTPESVPETPNTLTDSRDGHKYRTAVIGGNRWMAENLNYRPLWGKSWCYDNDKSNCDKYGRLYALKTAKTVCPYGWHLPSRFEWDDLVETAGGSSAAGKALKAKDGWNDYTSGDWERDRSGNGTDDYGFSALPGGVRTADDRSCRTGGYFDRYGPVGYCHAGYRGEWWTSSEEEFERAPETYTRSISHGWNKVYDGADNDPRHAFSVRCAQDGNNAEEKEKQRIEKLSEYFTDSRDGRVYRAVTIGANTWMAQNLDYKPKEGKSWCYGNNNSNCVKYGRLYDWNTAMAVCPSGWRLPTSREWDILGQDAGGKVEENYVSGVSNQLKAKNGWRRFGYGNDNYGFSALPGGYRLANGDFNEIGAWATWWAATKIEDEGPYHRRMFAKENFMNEFSCDVEYALSVRCVKDGK